MALGFCTEISHELQAHVGAPESEGVLTELWALQSHYWCPVEGGKGRERLDLCSDLRQSQAPSLV